MLYKNALTKKVYTEEEYFDYQSVNLMKDFISGKLAIKYRHFLELEEKSDNVSSCREFLESQYIDRITELPEEFIIYSVFEVKDMSFFNQLEKWYQFRIERKQKRTIRKLLNKYKVFYASYRSDGIKIFDTDSSDQRLLYFLDIAAASYLTDEDNEVFGCYSD